MDIFMAVAALCPGFGKYQRYVALPAVEAHMLAIERELRLVVVKGIDRFIELPSLGAVTDLAVYPEIWPVR